MRLKFNSERLVFIGDIHGEFDKLRKIVKDSTNTTFIVAGDCGFGFHDTKADRISKMVKANWTAFLEKRNLYLLFVRGNHDDPSYFNTEVRNTINTDRFILVPDYSTVNVVEKTVLCIGGAVSIDRRIRKTGSSYWLGEEILAPGFMVVSGVDILCTHTISRKYVNWMLGRKDWIKISFAEDKKLTPDCDREDEVCDLIQKIYKPKVWIHGHYHISYNQKTIDGTCDIVGLNINECYEIK